MATEGVGVFTKDEIADIVYEIILVNGNHGGRSQRSLDPDFPGHHIATQRYKLIGFGRGYLFTIVRFEESVNQPRLVSGEDTLSSWGSRRSLYRRRS